MKYRYRSDEEMKDSGVEWIGKIPKDWEIKKLKYITFCEDEKRIPLSSEERGKKEGKIPYWGANSIIDYIDEYLIDYEVILIGEDGAPFFDKYKDVAFYSNEKIWPNNHVHILKARNNMNPRFIVKALNIVDFKNYIKGSTRDKLTQTDMKEILIQTPFIKEQNKIANFLDKKTSNFDSIISKKEKSIEKLEEAKKSLISEVVTGKVKVVKNGEDFEIVKRNDSEMKDSGVEWIGKIPKDWEVKRLKNVLLKIGSGKTPKGGAEVYQEKGVLFIRSQNVYNSGLKMEDIVHISEEIDGEMKNSRVYKNDVLLNITGASIGRSSIFEENAKANVNQHVCILRPNKKYINSKILNKIIQSGYIQNQIKSVQNGSSREGLNFEQIGNMKFIIDTNIENQKIINSYLDKEIENIYRIIELTKVQIEKLKEAKQALISEAVTGKIEIL